MTDETRKAPRTVIAASALTGLVALGAVYVLGSIAVIAVNTIALAFLTLPVLVPLFLAVLGLTIGCIVTLRKILRGTHRAAATWFNALLLVVLLGAIAALLSLTISGGVGSWPIEYTGLVIASLALWALASLAAVAAAVLLWRPAPSRAYFLRQDRPVDR